MTWISVGFILNQGQLFHPQSMHLALKLMLLLGNPIAVTLHLRDATQVPVLTYRPLGAKYAYICGDLIYVVLFTCSEYYFAVRPL